MSLHLIPDDMDPVDPFWAAGLNHLQIQLLIFRAHVAIAILSTISAVLRVLRWVCFKRVED